MKEFQKNREDFKTVVCVTNQHRGMVEQVLYNFEMIELNKNELECFAYLTEVLHYFDKYWNRVFISFIKNSNCLIDSKFADRIIAN